MKVQSVELKYFNKFRNPPQYLILQIQTIATTLGTAIGRLPKISDLEWAGFNYDLLANNWEKLAPEVTLQVHFSSKLRLKPRDKFCFYQSLDPPSKSPFLRGTSIVALSQSRSP